MSNANHHRLTPSAITAVAALMMGSFLLATVPVAQAQQETESGHVHALPEGTPGADQTQIWAIARGGQLYDKWAAVIAKELPKTTHPSYPAAGKKKGSDTWRCKECHGWDYKGAKGAYAKGSHFTGIKGLRDMVGVNPEIVHRILMDDTHRYTEEMLPHLAMEQIALFVSRGQIDMDLYIDRETKKSRGNPTHGASYFQTICAVCHGFDGKQMNFGTAEKPEYVGTVASDNPWEFMHKARFAQPGVPMISLITLPVTDLADILAFAQTLPTK